MIRITIGSIFQYLSGHSFIFHHIVKSKDGFCVTGKISELMLDQMKEGTLLQCTSYNSGSFEAKVLNVSDYPVDSSNAYYGGDSNPCLLYTSQLRLPV